MNRYGFTLIELSIVLVIIGLIVGGVLVGRDLIAAAEVRAQVSQIERYNSAVNTFRGKYNALPGDLNAVVASAFGFAARGANGGQGDGNGLIEGNYGDCPGCNFGFIEGIGETVMFWTDLTYANGMNVNLIEGSFRSASATAAPTGPVSGSLLNNYFPSAKIGSDNYIYVYTRDNFNISGINMFGLSKVKMLASSVNGCAWCIGSDAAMTVMQAHTIDKKVDDAIPSTGRVVALLADAYVNGGGGIGHSSNAVSPSATTCFDITSNTYSITQNNGKGVNCSLSFMFQ